MSNATLPTMNESDIIKAFEGRWRIKGNYGQINSNGATMSFDEFYNYIKGMCLDFFRTGIMIGAGQPLANIKQNEPTRTNIDLRAESFYQQVHSPEYTSKYPPRLLADFYSYWSEPNKSKTKMRFELQKTWDLSRRLATWARNDFNHYGNSTNDNREKLASILAP